MCRRKPGCRQGSYQFCPSHRRYDQYGWNSVYQGVAAVFIAQAFGLDLSLSAQLGIIFTATLASIGTAAVPSAGIVMLVIVLAQAGIPEAGLALIFAIDRPLDMCRTIVNVTGDAAVSMLVGKSIGKLKD